MLNLGLTHPKIKVIITTTLLLLQTDHAQNYILKVNLRGKKCLKPLY